MFEVKYPSLVSKRSEEEVDTSSRIEDDEEDEGNLTKLRMQTNTPYNIIFVLKF